MSEDIFEEHLRSPYGRGPAVDGSYVGSAGGAACGDLVRVAFRVVDDALIDVSFDADGCGAALAAGSACASLVEGLTTLDAARIGPTEIANELGGLSVGKMHAADLASDALHRALACHWTAAAERGGRGAPVADRALVAMSGGVDSAVAALLTQRAGSDAVAVTLKLWADERNDEQGSCCSPTAVVGARALAHSLGMPHLTLDLRDRFRATVVDDFISEHSRGRTPNPCVRCNGRIRFDGMLALADVVGASRLVTGHYARIERDDQGPLLGAAADSSKDQAYMLAALRPELLDRLEFPLSTIPKTRTRAIAREARMAVADRPDSQDLCFVAGTDRERFLERHGGLVERPGKLVDDRDEVVGIHRGHTRYTVGQRRGLGIATGKPLYVTSTDATTNRVFVGPREQLAADTVVVGPAVLFRGAARASNVKLRYRSDPIGCSIDRDLAPGAHESLTIALAEDVHGVATGQVACLYDDRQRVVGHGLIRAASAGRASPTAAK